MWNLFSLRVARACRKLGRVANRLETDPKGDEGGSWGKPTLVAFTGVTERGPVADGLTGAAATSPVSWPGSALRARPGTPQLTVRRFYPRCAASVPYC